MIEEMPLTTEDKKTLKKHSSNYYLINILLLPLLIVIYFWGVLYFSIFALLTILWNIYAVKKTRSLQQESARPKLVTTGRITNKITRPAGDSHDTIIFLGAEEFNITYAMNDLQPDVGDTISLHYSQKVDGQRGVLLKIQVSEYNKHI
jgi:hypothetical protein